MPESAVAAAGLAGGPAAKLADLCRLCKPRVVALVTFTAVIGMLLAEPAAGVSVATGAAAVAGIFLVASSAAAFNCVFERFRDAVMGRTRGRPLPRGRVHPAEALAFASAVCATGVAVLLAWVNPLTMWLTLLTFVGYAVLYTVLLKPATPQNIVIGGLSGAMPPVLGWAAVTGSVGHEPLLLALIIFLWTPPHFWALAIYRGDDYRKAGLPMMPVTHGRAFTELQVLLYAVALAAASLLPFVSGMSGWVYLALAPAVNARLVWLAWRLWREDSDRVARRLFGYSITYLYLMFAALLADAHLPGALAAWLSP